MSKKKQTEIEPVEVAEVFEEVVEKVKDEKVEEVKEPDRTELIEAFITRQLKAINTMSNPRKAKLAAERVLRNRKEN